MKFAAALLIPASAMALAPSPRSSSGALKSNQLAGRRQFLSTSAAATAAVVLGGATPSQAVEVGGKMVVGEETLMSQKGHGTSAEPVQQDLMYGVDNRLADKICNYNRQ